MHPSYLGFQVDWPVFVKQPLSADNKNWKRGEHFNWLERGLSEQTVSLLYATGFIYHNTEFEVQAKVGDRLSEMSGSQLSTLVGLINSEVKSRTSSLDEYKRKKCPQSKIDTKQRGIIRRFLNNNAWITEDFYRIRDGILGD